MPSLELSGVKLIIALTWVYYSLIYLLAYWFIPWPSPWVSHSHANSHLASSKSSKLLFKCFYQFVDLAASAPGKHILVVSFLTHFPLRIRGGGLTVTFVFLWRSIKSHWFSVCSTVFDVVVRTRVMTSKLLNMSELKLEIHITFSSKFHFMLFLPVHFSWGSMTI